MGNISSPTRFGASESAATPPADCPLAPARSAHVKVGLFGLNAYHLDGPIRDPVREVSGNATDQAAAPTATRMVSRSGAC